MSDGANYSVQGNLTITTNSAFATAADQLGNPYQIITGVTGTRTYTYIPSGQTLVSQVTGLSTGAYAFADQRFYPYALLSSAPGVYTMNTAPYFDYDGLEFNISPSAPVNGAPIGNTAYPQYNSTSVYFTTPVTSAYLTEGYYINPPNVNLQTQSYTLLP